MSTPDVGAFGVAIVGSVLLLRFAALGSAVPEVGPVIGVWAVARALAAIVLTTGTHARRDGGLASAFASTPRLAMWLVFASTAIVGSLLAGPAAVACAAAACAVVLLGVRRVGGYTGDVLGAAIVVGETVGLLVVALP